MQAKLISGKARKLIVLFYLCTITGSIPLVLIVARHQTKEALSSAGSIAGNRTNALTVLSFMPISH